MKINLSGNTNVNMLLLAMTGIALFNFQNSHFELLQQTAELSTNKLQIFMLKRQAAKGLLKKQIW